MMDSGNPETYESINTTVEAKENRIEFSCDKKENLSREIAALQARPLLCCPQPSFVLGELGPMLTGQKMEHRTAEICKYLFIHKMQRGNGI